MVQNPSFNRQGKFIVCFGSLSDAANQYEEKCDNLGSFTNARHIFYYLDDPDEPFVFVKPDKEFSEGRIKE
jgi:hypothetical protein